MGEDIVFRLKKDKIYEYIKLNSNYIKDLYRNPEKYEKIKNEIKEKYNLRFRDKVSNMVDDIELVTSIIGSLN